MPLLRKVDSSLTNGAIISLVSVLLSIILLTSCAINTPVPASIPVPQFTAIDLGIPNDALQSPVVGQLQNNKVLHVRITFKLNQKWVQQVEQQKIQPGTPSHLEKFANNLGISDSTYQKIKNLFNQQGIVFKLSKLHTNLAIDAKASTFAKILQTKFVIHKYKNRTFYAPATPPKVPNFLASSIDAITGLDSYSTQPVHNINTSARLNQVTYSPAQPDCSPPDNTLLPRDIAGAYGHSQLWQRGLNGENMTVNLVEIDGFYRNDVQNYLSCINFKGKLQTINVDGHPQDALGESTLDIQMVAGLARSTNIVVYQTDANNSDDVWGNVNDELQLLLENNTNNASSGNTVSISLGIAENQISSNDVRAIDSSLQQLTNLEHMTIFVASGDCGAFTSGAYGDLSVSFPASDPWVTSVGGTLLQVDTNHNHVGESVWSDDSSRRSCKNRWGSGGGNSILFKKPNWQNAPGVQNQYSRGTRQVPDVSAAAYALAVYFQGQWGVVGGTSAAAPIWAAGLSLVNEGLIKQTQSFHYGPQLFYLVNSRSNGTRPYYDITQGNNLYFPATPGWDFTTGLGTPNLTDFYQVISTAQ